MKRLLRKLQILTVVTVMIFSIIIPIQSFASNIPDSSDEELIPINGSVGIEDISNVPSESIAEELSVSERAEEELNPIGETTGFKEESNLFNESIAEELNASKLAEEELNPTSEATGVEKESNLLNKSIAEESVEEIYTELSINPSTDTDIEFKEQKFEEFSKGTSTKKTTVDIEKNIKIKKAIALEDNEVKADAYDEISSMQNLASAVPDNTDPNYAYLLPFDQSIIAQITVQGECRWYGVIIDADKKISPRMLSAATNDFDLYVYKLNQSTMTLNPVGYSEKDPGYSEIVDVKATAGEIYYIMVRGYSGSGAFQLTAHTSTYDLQYEVNDQYTGAKYMYGPNFSVKGVIDNPEDWDIYQFSFAESTRATFSLTQKGGLNYTMYLSYDGIGWINDDRISAGPWQMCYVLVCSKDGTYNREEPYTVSVKGTAKIIQGVDVFVETKDGKNVFQLDYTNGKYNYYLNGKGVSFYWSHFKDNSNSAGVLKTAQDLTKQNTEYVPLRYSQSSLGVPIFGRLHTSYSGYQYNNVLLLPVAYTKFQIVRTATGAYAPSFTKTFDYAKIAINCDTGEVIDEVLNNFWYTDGPYSAGFSSVDTRYNYLP